MTAGFLVVVRRELRLVFRQGADALLAVGFFVIATALFPFGVGPEPNVLARIAPGVVWVAALLAAMLSLERLFAADYEDGSLDLLATAPLPLSLVVAAKCLAHWLASGLPLVVAAPLLGVALGMPAEAVAVLIAALLLGTPVLILVGAIGAALSLGARRGGVLLSLLVLPLFVPVLIFGVAAVDAAIAGLPARPHLSMLAAMLLASAALCPWVSAAALRQAIE